ncbi:hypothetical protein LF1_14520 [Rubripirellula obstinata]|uniref:Uncharacterized protein n=1 Tax=Rubripirellula obstinata TaxID=406547 RepID=A0A5B1CCN0_9BACT|nr:hypothetical protein [Rubripirellula obstinata]KAA1258928.1 hypothetical protein LF1_14520 [Rubripirellula obstinata]
MALVVVLAVGGAISTAIDDYRLTPEQRTARDVARDYAARVKFRREAEERRDEILAYRAEVARKQLREDIRERAQLVRDLRTLGY